MTITPTKSRPDVRTYKGIGVSPGIAIGRAVIIEKREASVYRVPIRDEEVVDEVGRFNAALEKTRDELLDLKHKVSRSMGDEYAQIFEAHAMIVTDPSFMDKVVGKIEQCLVVGAGNDQRVTLEHRPLVEEREDVRFVEDDVRGRGAGDDRAEHAIAGRHACVTGRRAGSSRAGTGMRLRYTRSAW